MIALLGASRSWVIPTPCYIVCVPLLGGQALNLLLSSDEDVARLEAQGKLGCGGGIGTRALTPMGLVSSGVSGHHPLPSHLPLSGPSALALEFLIETSSSKQA